MKLHFTSLARLFTARRSVRVRLLSFNWASKGVHESPIDDALLSDLRRLAPFPVPTQNDYGNLRCVVRWVPAVTIGKLLVLLCVVLIPGTTLIS